MNDKAKFPFLGQNEKISVFCDFQKKVEGMAEKKPLASHVLSVYEQVGRDTINGHINKDMCQCCLSIIFWPENEDVALMHKIVPETWSFYQHPRDCKCQTLCTNQCRTCFPPHLKSDKGSLTRYEELVRSCRCRMCLKHATLCECVRKRCCVCGQNTQRKETPKSLNKFFDPEIVDEEQADQNLKLFDQYCDSHLSVCKKHKVIVDLSSPTGCESCYASQLVSEINVN